MGLRTVASLFADKVARKLLPTPRSEEMLFYQTIDVPGHGLMPGCWDHRASVDVFLAHTNFHGLSAIDIGPANGFWSFEMERRGASQVVALELGLFSQWDAVPHSGLVEEPLRAQLRHNVALTKRAFRFTRRQLGSRVRMMSGSAYEAARVLPVSDVVLMGNVLQHLRDPLLAIHQASLVTRKRIIISETIWDDDPLILEEHAVMRLIPRVYTPKVNHSWWQVSPPLIGEFLHILGFVNLRCEYHEQLYYPSLSDRSGRMVRHFTYTGER